MFGTEKMRYIEEELSVRFRNEVTISPFSKQDKGFLLKLVIFAKFLAMYTTRMKYYELLKGNCYEAMFKRHKLENPKLKKLAKFQKN
jgi:hypothetical protein